MTSIVDDRGQELLYAGMPITDVIKEDMGIGGVLSLLWFRKRFVCKTDFIELTIDLFSLPKYATKFLEMILMVTADHGPAVSGAHNTIVCARAGKDLVSCLASGLLTIVRKNINKNSTFSVERDVCHDFRAIVSVVHLMMLRNNSVQHMMLVYIQQISSIKCVKKVNL